MGPAYVTAYRYYKDDPATPAVEETIFDRLLVGSAVTAPIHITALTKAQRFFIARAMKLERPNFSVVTDSAASATALSTGFKSYNGAIGVDASGKPLKTLLEAAKAKGMKTGITATSQINHATPASFLAHHSNRRDYDLIADQYLASSKPGNPVADVMLGGGTEYFVRDDENLGDGFPRTGFLLHR